MEITINTQAELDSTPRDFKGTIYIDGGTPSNPLILRVSFDDATVIMRGNATAELRGNAHITSMIDSSHVTNMWSSSHITYMRDSSHVTNMYGSSHITNMRDSSHITNMWDSGHITNMMGSSHVTYMYDSSHVTYMYDSSHVTYMYDSSHITYMYDSSRIEHMYAESSANAYGKNKIVTHGYNIIKTKTSNKDNLDLTLSKNSQLILVADFEATFESYQERYPVEVVDGIAVLYKAVHKREDGVFFSDYDKKFTYAIGEKKTHECSASTEQSCSVGLHVSHEDWVLNFGRDWSDLAILECHVPIDKIVVSKDCDGKIRTSELTVVREIGKIKK